MTSPAGAAVKCLSADAVAVNPSAVGYADTGGLRCLDRARRYGWRCGRGANRYNLFRHRDHDWLLATLAAMQGYPTQPNLVRLARDKNLTSSLSCSKFWLRSGDCSNCVESARPITDQQQATVVMGPGLRRGDESVYPFPPARVRR